MKRTLLAAALLLVGACTSNVQTTSGEDYLARYTPSSQDTGTFNEAIRHVAAVEPTLRFPARIGLARIDRRRLSALSEEEIEAWVALAGRVGGAYGEFIPVSPLIAELVAEEVGKRDVRNVVGDIRLAAARQHLDVVLIYEVFGTSNSTTNPLSILDWTIIGAFVLPGRSVDTSGFANALLVDVRNGYPYGTASASVDRSSIATGFAARDTRRDEAEVAKIAAGVALAGEVEAMMAKLASELMAKSIDEDAADVEG